MSSILTYRDLEVWQESMKVAELAYQLTRLYPKEERYALTSQTQRAAVSIPANIAEGHARRSRREYHHHLSIARGSLAELETHVILATRLEYVNKESVRTLWDQLQRTGRLLNGLLRSIKTSI